MLTEQLLPEELTAVRQMLHELIKKNAYKERFVVKRGQTIQSIHVTDIAYFFSRNKISYLKTHEGKEYLLSQTLGEIEKSVSPEYFYRASRSFIISYRAIQLVSVWWNGKLKLHIRPEIPATEILISRERVAGFKIWLGE
ncbi:LytR/AlgR family response regulator transcription factor [Chitinophaga barathri]|nr:LytTR family DNA-binding domain-containing protein [Chitinophaga barathri]